MKLVAATSLAQKLLDAMRPFCLRVEIAGSIRRKIGEVKDIEIVAIPKWIERDGDDLFQTPVPVNALHEWATLQNVQWIKPGTSQIQSWPIKPDGKYWRALLADGIKLDLFLANESNWGVIFAIRTGPAEFSEALVTHARFKTPYFVEGGYLRAHDGGQIRVCTEETHLFFDLGLDWIEPEKRTGRAAIIEL